LHLAYETNVNPVGRHIGSTLDAASGSANACVPRVTQQDVLEVVGMLRPWLTARTPKLRFGNPYDGGYVVPATALDCTDVLSIGIGGDVSFDLALADRGARVLQFDHTVDRAPRTHPNCTFHRLGWGPRSEAPFLSLAAMSGMLANPNARQALLKFDIEGAEYSILDAVETEQLALFTVIVCEIHDLGRLCEPAFFELVRSGLKKLTHRHTLVHLHANNSQNIVMVAGVPIPPVLEISLLRHDVDDFPGLSREPIPGPLDWPNYPFLPDICMNPF